jgi:hypothetical protein
MIIDCLTCPVRGQRCDECVVTVLAGAGPATHHRVSPGPELPAGLQLDAAENKVVSMLVGAGLVSPGAVVGLCARRESVRPRSVGREVG